MGTRVNHLHAPVSAQLVRDVCLLAVLGLYSKVYLAVTGRAQNLRDNAFSLCLIPMIPPEDFKAVCSVTSRTYSFKTAFKQPFVSIDKAINTKSHLDEDRITRRGYLIPEICDFII